MPAKKLAFSVNLVCVLSPNGYLVTNATIRITFNVLTGQLQPLDPAADLSRLTALIGQQVYIRQEMPDARSLDFAQRSATLRQFGDGTFYLEV